MLEPPVTIDWSMEDIIEDCEVSEIDCPNCGRTKLRIYHMGIGDTYLVCPDILCRYEERE